MVGEVYKLKKPIMGNDIGIIGIVYHNINFNNNNNVIKMIIFENGEYCGFSSDEVNEYLDLVNYDVFYSSYNFINSFILSKDFDNGYWSMGFIKYSKIDDFKMF